MPLTLEPMAPVTTTAVGHRILESAARLFRANGITATGVDRIVEDADTTKRTLYQRFGSKDAVVAAYLQQRSHAWQRDLMVAVRGREGAAALELVYAQTRRWAAKDLRGCAFVNAWAEVAPTEGAAAAVVREEKEWMRDLFRQVAGDPARGEILHLLHEGAQVTGSIRRDVEQFDLALDASLRLLATASD